MSFVITPESDRTVWEFQTEEVYPHPNLALQRYNYLAYLDGIEPLTISIRNPKNNTWTKHEPFPSLLLTTREKSDKGFYIAPHIACVYEVHRYMLENEIVVESDYKTYEENYEAICVVGAMLEERGFVPHYYFSGGKSVHAHMWFDLKQLLTLPLELQHKIYNAFDGSRAKFMTKFMKWVRTQCITCFGTNVRQFDTGFLSPKHLVRAELSRHTYGYKTFMGYSYKDIPSIMPIKGEQTGLRARVVIPVVSVPRNLAEYMQEFLQSIIKETKVMRMKRENTSLFDFGKKDEGLRPCVTQLLSEEFILHGDGCKRALYILANELRKVFGDESARIVLHDWNTRMNTKFTEDEIESKMKNVLYDKMGCSYVHTFLRGIGKGNLCCHEMNPQGL